MKHIFTATLAVLILVLAGCTEAPEPSEDTDVTEEKPFVEADITDLPSLALSSSVYDADSGAEIQFAVIADDGRDETVCRIETDGGSVGYVFLYRGEYFDSTFEDVDPYDGIPDNGNIVETEAELVFSEFDKPEHKLSELETFNWRPSEDGETPELSYVKVVFTEAGQNVGYAFAEIEYDGAGHAEARLLCRGTFPKADGKYQGVTDFYIDRRTFEAREQSRREHAAG